MNTSYSQWAYKTRNILPQNFLSILHKPQCFSMVTCKPVILADQRWKICHSSNLCLHITTFQIQLLYRSISTITELFWQSRNELCRTVQCYGFVNRLSIKLIGLLNFRSMLVMLQRIENIRGELTSYLNLIPCYEYMYLWLVSKGLQFPSLTLMTPVNNSTL